MSAIRLAVVLVAACGLGLAAAGHWSAKAAETNNPSPPPEPPRSSSPAPKSDAATTKKKKKKDQKSEQQQFLDGYRAAHALIYQQHEFAAGIAALRALGHDEHPDVANLIGYSSRKLGRYDDAKLWYEKALAADPQHARTWSYYGMWHAEQGNVLKARDHLTKVASICGTECREYTELKEVIEGTRVY
jgi:tetratricopeptide (TPR) repeat protein